MLDCRRFRRQCRQRRQRRGFVYSKDERQDWRRGKMQMKKLLLSLDLLAAFDLLVQQTKEEGSWPNYYGGR